jgi:hypothetical protein
VGNIRPQKIIKLNYWQSRPEFSAHFTLYGSPAEARMAANDKTFISTRQDGISLSPGPGNNVNIQALPQNLKYAGMISDLPFPLSLIPVTIATPFPNQIISPPLVKQLPLIKEIAVIASSFVGV